MGTPDEEALELFARVHHCDRRSSCLAAFAPAGRESSKGFGVGLIGLAVSGLGAIAARRNAPPKPRPVFVGIRSHSELVVVEVDEDRSGRVRPGPIIECAWLGSASLDSSSGAVSVAVASGTLFDLHPPTRASMFCAELGEG